MPSHTTAPPARVLVPLLVLLFLAGACGSGPPPPPPGPALASRASEPPPSGECPSVVGAPILEEGKGLVDAAPALIEEGMMIEADQMLMLRRLLPPVVWQHREVFFYEGMRMEVGECHVRYPSFSPFQIATRKFKGQARIDDEGNLENYTAGLPFPPETITPNDPQAALKWAWNLERRYRGAGFRGRFRITELASAIGGDLSFEGELFYLQTGQRTDLAEQDYHLPNKAHVMWAAGGIFDRPFDARHLAWRQFRTLEALEDFEEPDDIFVYVPTMRKQRRAGTNWVDGLYMPTYTATNEGAGGSMPYGSGGEGIAPTSGLNIAMSTDKGHGLTGVSIRPNAYVWRYLGEQTVLAPINANQLGYPADEKRNYGYSGLSVASDRWDVRYAVIIEGALKAVGSDIKSVEIWIDRQTQQPLYWISRTGRRRLYEVGVFVHRFTGDVPRYPEWPGGVPASIFEPVGAFFLNARAGGGGWRREAYDLNSTPFTDGERRRMTSADNLGKGR